MHFEHVKQAFSSLRVRSKSYHHKKNIVNSKLTPFPRYLKTAFSDPLSVVRQPINPDPHIQLFESIYR